MTSFWWLILPLARVTWVCLSIMPTLTIAIIVYDTDNDDQTRGGCGSLFSDIILVPLFPTCQVRVVRFYQSACPPLPPPPPPPHSPPPPPRLAVLLALLLANCWTSTWALPSSVCTAGPQPASCPAQCAPLDLNRGPAQLSVCTAGPQPRTCPAQCAPLDLNLGPSQLSVRRWTSTAR